MLEYALLVSLIAVVSIGAVTYFGEELSAKFSEIANKLAEAW